MRFAFLYVLAVTVICQAIHADDLDVIVDEHSTTQQRGEAYNRLVTVDFARIAKKLATLAGNYPILTGLGPRTDEPWAEDRLEPHDKIACTLYQLWRHHMQTFQTNGPNMKLFFSLLMDPTVDRGRGYALYEIGERLPSARGGPNTTWSKEEALKLLEQAGANSELPSSLRRDAVKLLFEHGDVNLYLDLAIKVAASEKTPEMEAETFRLCTPGLPIDFSEANFDRYVRHCFSLLMKANDGCTGRGASLAIRLGRFVGVEPSQPSGIFFAPDRKLPQDQFGDSGTLRFFQDTVNNALKWWIEHQAEFRETGP